MAILNLKGIKSPKELEEIARRDLEGKTLHQIMPSIVTSDESTRVSTKAFVGYVIEEGYFGIGKNNTAGPDIGHLGVEIKTSPLKFAKDGKLRVKEPLSLNIINYSEEHKNQSIIESSLYKKNNKTLFVWYIHDENILRSEYLIKYVFLWEMKDEVLEELESDYQKILDYVRLGKAHEIHQYHHNNLTICPKHGGTFKDPNDKKSKTKQPFNTAPAEIRAFRLKNEYMNTVIRRYLKKEKPEDLSNFAPPKKPKLPKNIDDGFKQDNIKIAQTKSPYMGEMVNIPLFDSVGCGELMFADSTVQEMLPVKQILMSKGSKYFILRTSGDSMNQAGINDGDLVLCRKDYHPEIGNKVVALIGDDATIKEFHREGNEVVLMPKSSNPKHKPMRFTDNDEIKIQGVVVCVIENQDD